MNTNANTTPATPADYFIRNLETGKLELHFAKATYAALSEADKANVKRNFLWGRNSGCWISRCKEPNLAYAIRCAESIGLADAGRTGERLSFADQMARKAEKAERRAEHYDAQAAAADQRGEALQAPINQMHGDIAFFTQPNINTSAGRAFTRKRDRMWAAFEQGFDEFRKSDYWQSRAKAARATASQKELQDKGFVMRRIKERESDIRKLKSSVEEYEGFIAALDRGETPRDHFGYEIKRPRAALESQIDTWLERLEIKLDELGFYQDCLDALGGVAFGPDNIKTGFVVQMKRWGEVTVLSTGPKNFTYRTRHSQIPLTDSYATILAVVSATEAPKAAHPFKVGDSFTCPRWNPRLGSHGGIEDVTYTVIRATDKSITLQTGEEKPFVRKPRQSSWREGEWLVSVTDLHKGTWYKNA